MAAGAVVQSLSRTGVALAALMIAIATTVGVGVMIQSFRQTVVRWLGASLPADIYVSPPSLVSNRPDAILDPALVTRITSTPGVARVNTLRTTQVPSAQGPVVVLALDADARGYRAFSLKAGDDAKVPSALAAGGVLVSEPFANRRKLVVGASLSLVTDRGSRAFAVAGIYHDYASSEGTVVMARSVYERFWDDRAVSSLGVYAAPGIDVEELVAAVRQRVGPGLDVLIRPTRALREASLVVFERTFAVTVVLRALVTLVAIVGVLSALTALALEREREVAVLRAQGLTSREVGVLLVGQTGLMGLVAGILAVPVGLVLALVLVFVINQRSFGWTLQFDLGLAELLQGPVLAVAAALAAGIYPARRIARRSLPAALRGE
jgi:putative ABC transport system permease protein